MNGGAGVSLGRDRQRQGKRKRRKEERGREGGTIGGRRKGGMEGGMEGGREESKILAFVQTLQLWLLQSLQRPSDCYAGMSILTEVLSFHRSVECAQEC